MMLRMKSSVIKSWNCIPITVLAQWRRRSGEVEGKKKEICAIIQLETISEAEQDDLCRIYFVPESAPCDTLEPGDSVRHLL